MTEQNTLHNVKIFSLQGTCMVFEQQTCNILPRLRGIQSSMLNQVCECHFCIFVY